MKMKKKKWSDLPEECWEMIFERLGHHSNVEPLSLVSKSFLSISNRIRSHFAMDRPTFLIHGTLSPFLARFPNLTSISLVEFPGDLNQTLLHIAASGLKVETLDISRNDSFPTHGLALLGKNVKVFICSCVRMVGDPELAFIADSFPLLEELDISYIIATADGGLTENGIEHFASRVAKSLRKIDISFLPCIGDKSILAIVSNCFHLSEMKLLQCLHVTHNVFQSLVKRSSAFPGNQLSSLHICSALITDEFLINIANARFPLKKLTLHTYDSGLERFTFSSLSFLLQTYPSLEFLAFNSLVCLDDSLFAALSPYFRCLIKIELSDCYNLTCSSLFMLIKICPFLEDIEMQIYNRGKRNFTTDSVENPRIKSLNLAWSDGLRDKYLFLLSSICPKLERLDVSFCPHISNRGLEQILNKCSEISHLNIDYCQRITSIGTGGILKNLKFIDISSMEIDNIMLTMIGTRCTELEQLSMMSCKCKSSITDGLFEIIRNCKKLKYIHMQDKDVTREYFDLILLSIPSLTMFVRPSGFSFIFDSNRSCP